MDMHNIRDTIIRISAILILLVFRVGAQDGPGSPPLDYNQYGSFSTPSMVVIIVVLVAALFFMGFFSIYIRHCSDTSSSVAAVRNLGASLRRRAATRGLDRTILETFPTFGYSEVKDKKIGKGALECAVCLNEFEEDDTLRLIPICDHVFHPECIDAWLESHVTCPVCRANLAEPEQQNHEPGSGGEAGATGAVGEEVSITILEEEDVPTNTITTLTEETVVVCPPRTRSVKTRVWPKFPRSHSTGHSLVQPGENLDRFTLRLPKDFRKQVMTRALGRTSSCVVGTGGGRSFKRVDPMAKSKSDRWVFSFFSRGASLKSGHEGEGSSLGKSIRGSMKLPSFKCLEPKGDEICLVSGESSRPPV